MHDPLFDLTDQTMKELTIDDAVARQNVAWFADRYGAQAGAYHLLAGYAAMPLVLTPELLNYLHNRFLANAGLPWVAEVDLLLSELVHPVGEELYAMPPATRAYLLEELRRRVGDAELANVARVLIHYTRRLARTNPALDDEELRAQQWAAMVYLDELRATAVREVAEAFRAVADQLTAQPVSAPFDMQRAEFARLVRLTEMLEPQLQAHPELVEYAHLVSRQLAGDDAGAAEYGVQVEGVTLHVPEQLRPASRRDAPPATHLVYREIRIRIHHDVGENDYQVEVLFPTGKRTVSTHTLDARMLIVSASVFLEQRDPYLEREARQLGQELHDLLFDQAAAPHWAEARSAAHDEQQGLRLLLDVDPPELALMPWEILHDGNAFLSVTDGIEIIRLQPHSVSTAPVRTPGLLRILSVIASQPDLATIDTTNVKRALDEALTPALSAGLLELSWLENPSLAALRSVVRKQQFDVFYFVGYRAHDPQRQESYLLLTDNDGQAQRVSSIELSKLLATQRSLWLAVLSADDSARGEPGDPGLAAELAQSGIPAIVGVQGIMHYTTAVRFAQRFFDALVRGRAIAEAVQAARMEVHLAAPDRFEWALPVLHTAAPDAILVAPSEESVSPPLQPEVERALAILTDWEHYPPEERLKAGDELARRGDPRAGVTVRPENGLPDIVWCKVPEFGPDRRREFLYHDGTRNTPHPGLADFWIARYPITYAQFQVFVDAADGYRNREWRKGLADYFGKDGTLWPQNRPLANRPRERVTWPEAVAFCRWLTAQALRHPDLLPDGSLLPLLAKGWSIRLPTEQEWVKAARGFDDRLYPWGGQQYREGYANVDVTEDKTGPHYLQQTSPVGMYPHGASPFGVEELSGNVWEYCLNKYANPDDLSLGGNDRRAMRGGSYYEKSVRSSVAARDDDFVFNLVVHFGFRVVCAASP